MDGPNTPRNVRLAFESPPKKGAVAPEPDNGHAPSAGKMLNSKTFKAMPPDVQAKAAEWWANNPNGIYTPALFGTQGGLGEVGQAISKLDTDGDGYINRDEFRAGIAEALRAKANVTTLRTVALALGVAISVLVGVLAGTTFAIVDMAKDTAAGGDGVLKTRDGKNVIQTASADFKVSGEGGNVLTGRANANATGPSTGAVGTAKVEEKRTYGSFDAYFELSEDELRKLKTITIPTEYATMHKAISATTKALTLTEQPIDPEADVSVEGPTSVLPGVSSRLSGVNATRTETIVFHLSSPLHPVFTLTKNSSVEIVQRLFEADEVRAGLVEEHLRSVHGKKVSMNLEDCQCNVDELRTHAYLEATTTTTRDM